MPGEYESHFIFGFFMVLLKCFWSFIYLWILLQASAICPNVDSVWISEFWSGHVKYLLTYRSVLSTDWLNELGLFGILISCLYGLFRYSRCAFYDVPLRRQYTRQLRLNWMTLVYFIPYLCIFFFCWLHSMVILLLELLLLQGSEPNSDRSNIYSQLAITVCFKFLVACNLLSVCLRVWAILKIFAKEPVGHLINLQNFGDHLNVFLRI